MKFQLFTLLAAFGLFSCKSSDFQTTDNGLQYNIHTSQKGEKAKVGDFVKIHMQYKTEKDSILFSSYEMNMPEVLKVEKPNFQGDLMEGFTLMSEGDSASFLILADSLAQGKPLPTFLRSGSFVKFDVKLLDIMTESEYVKDMEKTKQEAVAKQAQEIENYAKEKNLSIQKTESGLYYMIEKPGTGENPKPGSQVTVHYKGYFLDGNVFDESYGRGEPITFPLGVGQVIRGWDEGIALFKKGGKGKLLIPSDLAYGPQGRPGMPGNSILIFDIELLDIK